MSKFLVKIAPFFYISRICNLLLQTELIEVEQSVKEA